MNEVPESPKNGEPLSEDAAHDEANMLRAELDVFPKTGRIPGRGYDEHSGRSFETEGEAPTAEDYDNALEAIEKLKRIAEEEPTFKKVIDKLRDLPAKPARGMMLAFRALGVGIETFSMAGAIDPDNEPGEGIGQAIKRRWEKSQYNQNKELFFTDAENQLKELKTESRILRQERKDGRSGLGVIQNPAPQADFVVIKKLRFHLGFLREEGIFCLRGGSVAPMSLDWNTFKKEVIRWNEAIPIIQPRLRRIFHLQRWEILLEAQKICNTIDSCCGIETQK